MSASHQRRRASPNAELSVLEFPAIPVFARMTKAERACRTREMVDAVYAAAVLAAEICARDKSSLMAEVGEVKYDTFVRCREEFADARANARALSEIIRAADSRLAAVSPGRNATGSAGIRSASGRSNTATASRSRAGLSR
jgi:hypothetical protein